MAKIPFNIKYRPQIESGEYKVETRDGKKVRVLCYDANNITPVVALVTFNDGSEGARDYYFDGSMNFDRENVLDLFIVTPEEEMSDFEAGLFSAFSDGWQQYLCGEDVDVEEWAKEHSPELLALARKELEPEVLERLEEAYKNQDEVVYENGKRDGKAEALKDLPRWKKTPGTYGTFVNTFEDGSKFLFHDGYCLGIKSLEEKLPGFKEDEIWK